jgi:hypothetical protein
MTVFGIAGSSPVVRVDVAMQSPSGRVVYNTQSRMAEGTGRNARGEFQSDVLFEMGAFTEPGTWRLWQVRLTDLSSTPVLLGGEELARVPGNNRLQIRGTADVSAPVFTEIAISVKPGSGGQGGATVLVDVGGSEEGSGVAQLSGELRGPGERVVLSEVMRITNAGRRFQGVLEFQIPEGSGAGRWRLTSLAVEDSAGNRTLVGGAAIGAVSNGNVAIEIN